MKHSLEHYRQLESGLIGLLVSLGSKLAVDESKEAREFIDAGEYGLAFETVCICLQKNAAAVSSDEYAEIQRIGNSMELPDTTWSQIRVQS